MGKGGDDCKNSTGGMSTVIDLSTVTTDSKALKLLRDQHPDLVKEMQERRWFEPYAVVKMASEITAEQLEIDPALALRLEAREEFPVPLDENGDPVTGPEAYAPHKDFLHPGRDLIRPTEETLPGAEAAAAELLGYIERGDKIAVFGDYDPDGTCSSALFHQACTECGAAPDQLMWEYASGGFGLTEDYVRQAHAEGAKLLVTVDCGSSQLDEVALAQELGMKVLIIDHHDAHPSNTADHHLNPSFYNLTRRGEPFESIADARILLERCEEARQNALLHPDDEEAQNELEECKTLARDMVDRLDQITKAEGPSRRLQVAIERAENSSAGDRIPNYNSASQLNWKFGAELLRQKHGETPESWYGTPMYLAATGALADAMPMDGKYPENRAFCRIPVDEGSATIPHLVQAVAKFHGEDPSNPGGMIRTRATLNMSKRTTRVPARLIAEGLRAQTQEEAEPLAKELLDHYEHSIVVRDKMQEEAKKDCKDRMPHRKADRLVAAALLDGYHQDSGQARILANQLVKQEGTTSVVGVIREDGLVKWSASGVYKAQIGKLLDDARLRHQMERACTVETVDAEGNPKQFVSMGGHLKVLSGVCTPENFDQVVATFEEQGRQVMSRDPYRWKASERKGGAWVQERMVSPERIHRLREEAKMLRPTTNGNWGMEVSCAVRAQEIGPLDDKRGTHPCVLELADGTTQTAQLVPDAATILGTGTFFEAKINPGEPEWWVRDLAPIPG